MEANPLLETLLSSWEKKEKVLNSTYKKLKFLDIMTVASSFIGLIIFQIEVISTRTNFLKIFLFRQIFITSKLKILELELLKGKESKTSYTL